jgi:hypothetical protein
MCNFVCLSTDGPEDLSVHNTELLRFFPLPESFPEVPASLLQHPRRWEVQSKSQCGCTFRHLIGKAEELEFGPPVDWYEEDDDAVAATGELYRVLEGLLQAERCVDLADWWWDTPMEQMEDVNVALSEIPEEAFRLFENRRFCLVWENPAG